jgi:transglutaminase-like putative cysteine protease
MRYQAVHTTTYRYEEPVGQCLSETHLTPRSFPGQLVLDSKIEVEPPPTVLESHYDYYGNEVSMIGIFKTHESLRVTATSLIDVDPPPARPLPASSWEDVRKHLVLHPDSDSLAAYEFTFDSPFVPASQQLLEFGAATFKPGRPLAEAVVELSSRIHKEFSYKPKSTSIDMPLKEVLKRRQGVCQDFAHIMIGVLRSYQLAARYVSGYLRSGAQYLGAEASHAWVSVYLPQHGWLDLDPTNNVIPREGHVTVAWGRDYGDVTPVKGISLGGGGQTVDVAVRVVPVVEPD